MWSERSETMAKWIIMGYRITCSDCGADEDKYIGGYEREPYGESRYCPNCGARMDGVIDFEDEVAEYWWGDDDENYA